jgi:hypothetical protein
VSALHSSSFTNNIPLRRYTTFNLSINQPMITVDDNDYQPMSGFHLWAITKNAAIEHPLQVFCGQCLVSLGCTGVQFPSHLPTLCLTF